MGLVDFRLRMLSDGFAVEIAIAIEDQPLFGYPHIAEMHHAHRPFRKTLRIPHPLHRLKYRLGVSGDTSNWSFRFFGAAE